jgi:hypothetical protein
VPDRVGGEELVAFTGGEAFRDRKERLPRRPRNLTPFATKPYVPLARSAIAMLAVSHHNA